MASPVGFKKCHTIPWISLITGGYDQLDGVSTICNRVVEDPPAGTGTKECGDGHTPPMDWIRYKVFSQKAGGPSFAVDMYVGIEYRADNTKCLWIGSEVLNVCVSSCHEVNERGVVDLSYSTLAGVVDKLWGEIEDAANGADETAPDYIPDIMFNPAVFAVAVTVIIAVCAFVVATLLSGISLSGGALGLFASGLGVLA